MLRVLIPTDFSPIANKAAEYAVKLFDSVDTEFVLFHCDNNPRPSYAFVNKLNDILKEEADKTGKKAIEEIKKATGLTDANITSVFTHGNPVHETEKYSRQQQVDLIVMGTKGEGEIRNRIFGSVAAGVLEHVSCPTIFVPASSGFELIEPTEIAFASDLTNIVEEMEELIPFAQIFDATINVVHVYPDMIDPDSFDEEKTQLEIIANSDYPKITFNAVMDSDIIKGLDRYVDEYNPHLLAMFTYKSKVLDYLFNKSYTEAMTMHAHTPLMILRKQK